MRQTLVFLSLASVLLSACASAVQAVPPPVVETGVDPDFWALVPAGEFLMGRHDNETMVTYDYEVMVTDVTNAQFASYLNEALAASAVKIIEDNEGRTQVVGYYPGDVFHAHEHEEQINAGDWPHLYLDEPALRLNYEAQQFTVQPGYENHPIVMVTWFGAKAYCDFSGWRLPTEVEWEKASRGGDGRPFPWGEAIARNNANYYSSHDVFEKIIGGLGDTTPVGYYNGTTYDGYPTLDSPSPYGLYDMAGNVWQWIADVQEGTHYRSLRGGSKADYEYNLRVWTRNSAGPTYASPNVGFRCARDQ